MATVELNETNKTITLKLVLVPKSSKDAIIGLLGDELKVCITAPPIDGKANAHLLKYLGKLFKTAKSNIELLKGETNKHKVVQIKNYTQIPIEVQNIISQI